MAPPPPSYEWEEFIDPLTEALEALLTKRNRERLSEEMFDLADWLLSVAAWGEC